MRVLLTGGGGYIGQHLRPTLQDHGYYVIPLYNWPKEAHRRRYDGPFEWGWFADLSRGFGVLTEEQPPDVVIHLAGRVDISLLPNPEGAHLPPIPGPCDLGRLYRDNVVATANVVQYCLQAKVKHLIFASSQAVYGVGIRGDWGDLRVAPLEHYAVSKLAAEYVVEMSREQGLMASILRLPGVFGGNRHAGTVYGMCREALRRGTIHVADSYPLPMNVMHIEDVIEAIAQSVAWKPPNQNWKNGMNIDISAAYELGRCGLDLLADEIAGLVPECKVVRGALEHPVLEISGGIAQRMLNWHPKSRKERLRQVLDEVRVGT